MLAAFHDPSDIVGIKVNCSVLRGSVTSFVVRGISFSNLNCSRGGQTATIQIYERFRRSIEVGRLRQYPQKCHSSWSKGGPQFQCRNYGPIPTSKSISSAKRHSFETGPLVTALSHHIHVHQQHHTNHQLTQHEGSRCRPRHRVPEKHGLRALLELGPIHK